MSEPISSPPASSARGQIPVAAGTVLLMYTGMMILNPLIAPLARVIGLAEWQIGLVVSVAALVMVVFSPWWGRHGGAWGRRNVLLITTVSGTVAIAVFALVAQFGLAGALSPAVVFILLLVVRGLWFGMSEAAVLPNVQAHVAETTPDAEDRVRGMAAIGAANGASLVIGSAIGGLLGAGGLLLPLWTTPVLMLAAVVLVAAGFRGRPVRHEDGVDAKVSPTDRRVLRYLVISFGSFTALGFMQILIGFLLQDRLHAGSKETALLTGIALGGAGIGLVLSQAVIVPRSHWGPERLIRVGLVIATLGFLALLPAWGATGIVVGVFLVGVGLGLATPGVNAGASLAVREPEQGAVAGLIAATNALTMVLAPLLSTVLYGVAPLLPLLVAAAFCAAALVLAALSRPADVGHRHRPADERPYSVTDPRDS